MGAFYFLIVVVVAKNRLYTTTTSALCYGLLFYVGLSEPLQAGCAVNRKLHSQKIILLIRKRAVPLRVVRCQTKPYRNKASRAGNLSKTQLFPT
jgi:hypothetical protein